MQKLWITGSAVLPQSLIRMVNALFVERNGTLASDDIVLRILGSGR